MVSVDGNNISSNALNKASKVGNISQEQDSEQQKLEIRKAAAQNISIAYDNAINTLKQYQGNQGILNAGFYREKLGQFLKNNNIADIKLCCDTAIKTLEQEKEFATNRLEYVANHEGDFKREFKEFTGKEYDEDAMKEFLVNASNGEDWTASYEKAYNVEKTDKNGNVSYENKIVNNALKKVKYQEYIDGAADIVIMLLGTGLISKGLGKGVGAIGKKISPYIPKVLKNISAKGLMKVGGNKVTVGAVLGAMAMQSATFSIWDASKNYINLKTKDIQLSGEDAANEWAAYKQGNVESAKFGAFAGLLSSTVVGKVVAGTTKLLEKPVSHAVTKNLAKTLDKSSSLTGKDIMQTFLTKQGPGVVANSAGMLAEISGFTMYETANEVTKELLKKDENGESHLPKDLTEEGLAKYLWKHFKGQATNLAEIKAISKLIFIHKGTVDIRNNIIKDNLSKCETLNNIKVEKKTDNGKTSFEVTMPDGSKSNVLTMEEVIAKCNVIMQFDMASNIKPSTNNEESVTPDNEQSPQDFDPTKTVLSATVRHDGEKNEDRINEENTHKQSKASENNSRPIMAENFEQQKADFIKEFKGDETPQNLMGLSEIEKISKPEDLSAVKEIFDCINTEEGKKMFPDGHEVVGHINSKNIADFKELIDTLRSKDNISDELKSDILYAVSVSDNAESTNNLIKAFGSDLEKIDLLDGTFIASSPSDVQKVMLEFYKDAKAGKYSNIIHNDNIFGQHMIFINDRNYSQFKKLYDNFANEENISQDWFAQVKEGLENSDADAIKQFYDLTKDLRGDKAEEEWLPYRNLKMEDIPSKTQILDMIKGRNIPKEYVYETLSKTNKENFDIAKELVEKTYINNDGHPENVSTILTKLNRQSWDKDFVKDNIDVLTHLNRSSIRAINKNNIELARVIEENGQVPEKQTENLLSFVQDKEAEARFINNVNNGIYRISKFERLNKLKHDYIEILKNHIAPEDFKDLEEYCSEESLLSSGSSDIRNEKLNDDEQRVINQILKELPYYTKGVSELEQASRNLSQYFPSRNRQIADLNYALTCNENETKRNAIIQRFEGYYPLLETNEIDLIQNLYCNSAQKDKLLELDYSKLAQREILSMLKNAYKNKSIDNSEVLEFLNCDDKEFEQKKANFETRQNILSETYKFGDWQRILNMSDKDFNRLVTPLEARVEEPVDVGVFESQMREKMAEPVDYDPVEAAKLIAESIDKRNMYSSFEDKYTPSKINPFEKLPKKPRVNVDLLPSTRELMAQLKDTGHVKLSIPNEGGVKVQPYDAIIHPEDRERLNVEEDADIKIRYGTKLQWSNFKIARDILQNYYDGHGHTLEGVDIEVNKTENGTYRIKISGESSWDYAHLDKMGSSTKHNPLDAGGYGEGTRAVAVSLLSKPDIKNVKYASGDWTMTYGRSSDDLKSAYMTQTLSQNESKVKGSTVEFETDDIYMVKNILDAQDYFNHPHNPDFQNFDFENEFFGIKLLPQKRSGNIYLIQRYETNYTSDNGLDGVTIVFKTQPNHPTLVEKDGGTDFKLGTGVDRAQIPSSDINRILSRYIKSMSDEELTQTISSMENFWKISEDKQSNTMFMPFIQEAKERGLGIDFKDSRYVYMSKLASPEIIEMAKLMGYKLAVEEMKDVGMPSFASVDESKMPHKPTEAQSKQIRLLEEGVRILQECTDTRTQNLLNSDEVGKPTYMFGEGGALNEGAEAIIENREYQGHWMRDSHLLLQNYVENLSTFLHEISHKIGPDTSERFSEQLIEMQSHITNVLMHNPNAIKKFQVLSKLFNEVKSEQYKEKIETEIIRDDNFEPEEYKQSIEQLISTPVEYKEYVVPEKSSESEDMYTSKKQLSDGNNKAVLDFDKSKLKTFEENHKITSRFNLTGIKRFAKSFINRILRRNKAEMPVETAIETETVTKPKKANSLKYQEYIPEKHDTYTTLKSTETTMKELEDNGHVEINIADSGGLNPKISEIPNVENDRDLNKTVQARMTVSYAEKRDWSNEKIARDLMQNFYDGNGHTLEGVDIKVNKNENGTYTVRIDGKGIYDYHHLKRLGGSDKDNPKDAGGYGEGSRIIAGSLLAKGSDRVRFACADWQMDFTNSDKNNKENASVLRTLTKQPERLDGNYVEFDTTDENLVKMIMESKNYFYNPHNPDFKDLDVENEFFGFKVTPEHNGNLYYIQRFQTPDKKMEGGMQDMTIVFKQAAFGDEFKNKVGYTIDLNTTRDRMSIEARQMRELSSAYLKTLSDAELLKALEVLEPIFMSKDAKSKIFNVSSQKKNLSYQFAVAALREAKNRKMNIDFGDKKVVTVDKINSEYSRNLAPKEEDFFREQGYIFCDNEGRGIGIPDAHELYEKLHRPHSVRPTERQSKQLQILNEAIQLIAENDSKKVLPDIIPQLYVYDNNSNVKSKTGFSASKPFDKLEGVFIHSKKLDLETFPNVLTNTMAEMIDRQTDKRSAEYSYNLTDLIRSQLDTLITQPQIVEKLNILEEMFKEQQKHE